jgi:hypothetical protein
LQLKAPNPASRFLIRVTLDFFSAFVIWVHPLEDVTRQCERVVV